jgi:hypothetical protein
VLRGLHTGNRGEGRMNRDRILALARQFSAYEPNAKIVSLRGESIVEFAQELCKEFEAEKIAELMQRMDESEARVQAIVEVGP